MVEQVRVVLFDVGGVLLTNGWDRVSRRRGVDEFDLDWEDFEGRHQRLANGFETGKLSLDDYLTRTVFHRQRSFTRDQFVRFMKSQSQPYPETLELVAALAATERYLLASLNNESRELNDHRIAAFGLDELLSIFLSSCYLGIRKPDEDIYRLALDITQCRPEECLFVDDRAVNLECAELVGLRTIQYHDAPQLRTDLARCGVHV